MSMEAIAAGAGVTKRTLYRWWSSKGAVVTEAVLSGVVPTDVKPPADTGDVVADLCTWMREQDAWHTDPGATALVRGLAAAAFDSDADAARIYDRLTGPVRDGLVRRLALGVEHGQLRADADLIEAAADAIIDSRLRRVLTRGETSTYQADAVVKLVVIGLGTQQDGRDVG